MNDNNPDPQSSPNPKPNPYRDEPTKYIPAKPVAPPDKEEKKRPTPFLGDATIVGEPKTPESAASSPKQEDVDDLGATKAGHQATQKSSSETDSEAALPTSMKPRGLAGQMIAQYRVIEEIGHGGQGYVFLAEDVGLKRRVALKVLTDHASMSEAARIRFLREAEVASKLDHSGICRVYEFGQFEGMPFIAMQLIEGRPLDYEIARGREIQSEHPSASIVSFEFERKNDVHSSGTSWVPDKRRNMSVVRFIEDAARALHVAHESGLIHRDIKPGNIMATTEGQAVILDFGLARDEQSNAMTLTQTGDLMGTPSYMSPEQIEADQMQIDRRTDIYSLGVTLYECLTLAHPFKAANMELLFDAIKNQAPLNPQSLNSAISKDLKVVIETAMERDRNRRYPTMLEFAEELRRIREFEPILARPASPFLKVRRWAQRNTALAASLTVFFLVVSLAATVLFFQNMELDQTNKELGTKTHEAEQNAERATQKTIEAEKYAAEAQANLKQAKEEAETARQVAKFIIGLFEESDPIALAGRSFGANSQEGQVLTARDVLDRGAKQLGTTLLDQPKVRAKLLDTVGNVYLGLGFPEAAAPLITEALEIRKEHLGEKHPEYTESLMSMALIKRGRGEAISDDLRGIVAIQKELLPPNDPRIASTLVQLSFQLIAEWKHEEAGQVIQEAQDICNAIFGSESREIAMLLLAEAQMKVLQREFTEGIILAKKAGTIVDKIRGNDFFSKMFLLFVRAQVVGKMNQPRLADMLYKKCITEGTAIVGENHFLLAYIYSEHAAFLNGQSAFRGDVAAKASAKALEIYQKVFGATHPMIAYRYVQLALSRRDQNQHEEAIRLTIEAVRICDMHASSPNRALAGDLKGHKASALDLMAECQIRLQRFAEAEKNLHASMATRIENSREKISLRFECANLILSLVGQGRLKTDELIRVEAQKYGKDFCDNFLLAGLLLEDKDDRQNGIVSLRLALAIDPQNAEADKTLSLMLSKNGH
ncbi:MAG: serine/threonine protein kinase [Planctomycetota bacterium]|jgi:serine/threonine protein kinase